MVASDQATAMEMPVITATIGESGRMTVLDVNPESEPPPQPPSWTEEELERLREREAVRTPEELEAWKERNRDLVERMQDFIRAQGRY